MCAFKHFKDKNITYNNSYRDVYRIFEEHPDQKFTTNDLDLALLSNSIDNIRKAVKEGFTSGFLKVVDVVDIGLSGCQAVYQLNGDSVQSIDFVWDNDPRILSKAFMSLTSFIESFRVPEEEVSKIVYSSAYQTLPYLIVKKVGTMNFYKVRKVSDLGKLFNIPSHTLQYLKAKPIYTDLKVVKDSWTSETSTPKFSTDPVKNLYNVDWDEEEEPGIPDIRERIISILDKNKTRVYSIYDLETMLQTDRRFLRITLKSMVQSQQIKIVSLITSGKNKQPCYQSISGPRKAIQTIDSESNECRELNLVSLTHFYRNESNWDYIKTRKYLDSHPEIPSYCVSVQFNYFLWYRYSDLSRVREILSKNAERNVTCTANSTKQKTTLRKRILKFLDEHKDQAYSNNEIAEGIEISRDKVQLETKELLGMDKVKITKFSMGHGRPQPCYQSIHGSGDPIRIIDVDSEEHKNLELCSLRDFCSNGSTFDGRLYATLLSVTQNSNVEYFMVRENGYSKKFRRALLESLKESFKSKLTMTDEELSSIDPNPINEIPSEMNEESPVNEIPEEISLSAPEPESFTEPEFEEIPERSRLKNRGWTINLLGLRIQVSKPKKLFQADNDVIEY